ncbi:uncharacterized protein Z520_02957 [Fonsecaea multimorphosa CBS 102226]|uniref:Uncharacterized protein n=1 Tax=Fonsecaea multimorphosa CBS 102226 TaxID=1442371 RepID=A0A0D2KDS4_9EURO|nr:uncharacterized protein Z520_02957 [Fonsecaea multimorphosa CBS 102226]KIY01405.1 hypothetical protein Z520_02957 [Fonsecaea multimorphosa CBS 102226]OAL28423.1 hypothetical protein AYO22_02877 [Fonsecaea multimorphosa]
MSPRGHLTTSTTYTLAHTAQCKLKIAANRPDRNLRFVLGHAFTLDNLMVRIVEIENQNAKSVFQEGKPAAPSDLGHEHEHEHYDCTAAPPPQPTTAPEPESRGRRVSFHDNNARPSSTAGVASNNNRPDNGTSSPSRKRSPPPAVVKHRYIDEEQDEDDTSSDDYDEPESYELDSGESAKPAPKLRPVAHDAYSDEEDAALELADDELDDDMNGLSLTRFGSAAAQPPRMVRSDSSSDEEEDEKAAEPVTPPQLPADVDVREILCGEKDTELTNLYESVRRCSCHGKHEDLDVGGTPQGIWDVPVEKTGGKHLAVVAIAA